MTALMMASYWGALESVQSLLARNADAKIKSNSGADAVSLAKRGDIRILIDHALSKPSLEIAELSHIDDPAMEPAFRTANLRASVEELKSIRTISVRAAAREKRQEKLSKTPQLPTNPVSYPSPAVSQTTNELRKAQNLLSNLRRAQRARDKGSDSDGEEIAAVITRVRASSSASNY
jgi:hypothetical protein